jgi:hypothetical protein
MHSQRASGTHGFALSSTSSPSMVGEQASPTSRICTHASSVSLQ